MYRPTTLFIHRLEGERMRMYTLGKKENQRKGQAAKVVAVVAKHGPVSSGAICKFLRKEKKDCVLWHVSQLVKAGCLKAEVRK
jgi:hypothetical protein